MLSIDRINELEAYADLMIIKANQIKQDCQRQRRKLEGVSTPSNARKGLSDVEVAQLIAKRRKRYKT